MHEDECRPRSCRHVLFGSIGSVVSVRVAGPHSLCFVALVSASLLVAEHQCINLSEPLELGCMSVAAMWTDQLRAASLHLVTYFGEVLSVHIRVIPALWTWHFAHKNQHFGINI